MKKFSLFLLFFSFLCVGWLNATDYYLKHPWGGGDWTWKQLTQNPAKENIYFINDKYGGNGCNYNTAATDETSQWVPSPTLSGTLAVGDSARFEYNTSDNSITITLISKSTEPVVTKYYIKHGGWGNNDWGWRLLTQNKDNSNLYSVREIYHGTGCNYNTVMADAGAGWIENPTKDGDLQDGDSAIFTLDINAKTITITKIGGSPTPIDTIYYLKHLWDGENMTWKALTQDSENDNRYYTDGIYTDTTFFFTINEDNDNAFQIQGSKLIKGEGVVNNVQAHFVLNISDSTLTITKTGGAIADYYIKHVWKKDSAATWKKMTRDINTPTLFSFDADTLYEGDWYYNTTPSDEGAKQLLTEAITTHAQLGDKIHIVLNVDGGNISLEVNKIDEPTPPTVPDGLCLTNNDEICIFYNANDQTINSNIHCHVWGGSSETSWPGGEATDLGNGYWKFTVPANCGTPTQCIWNDGNSGAGTHQTTDLTFTNHAIYNGETTGETVTAICSTEPLPTYYLKYKWDGTNDTWLELTPDTKNNKLYYVDTLYKATGTWYYNTEDKDEGATEVATTNISLYEGIALNDTIHVVLNTATTPMTITVTKKTTNTDDPTEPTWYIKHGGWGNNDWGWRLLTQNKDNSNLYSVREIYHGTGCNYNTATTDAGAGWIESPTKVGEPQDGDSAIFTLDINAKTITITKINTGTDPTPTPSANYYLVGSFADIDWQLPNAKPLNGDSIVLENLAAGTYQFRLLSSKSAWDSNMGYEQVDANCSSEGYQFDGGLSGSDNNIKITLPTAGTVKIKVVGGKICLTGNFTLIITITSYTIAGDSLLTGANWSETFTANDMTTNNDSLEWTLTKTNVTLTAGTYNYKVVANHTWGVADHPASGNQTLTITEDGTYDITFTYKPKLTGGENLTATATKKGESGIFDAQSDKNNHAKSVLIDGKIYILRDGELYSVFGQKVQ